MEVAASTDQQCVDSTTGNYPMTDINRQVVEHLEAAVLLVKEDGEVVLANERSVRLLGRDLTHENLATSGLADDLPIVLGVADSFRRAASTATACRDLLVRQDEDEIHYVWVTVSDNGGSGSREECRVVMMQDITAPLTESPALQRIFSQVNHDLRSPLTSIAGAAELLLSGRVGAIEGVQRRLVAIVEEGTQKMSAILTRTKNHLVHGQALGGDPGE